MKDSNPIDIMNHSHLSLMGGFEDDGKKGHIYCVNEWSQSILYEDISRVDDRKEEKTHVMCVCLEVTFHWLMCSFVCLLMGIVYVLSALEKGRERGRKRNTHPNVPMCHNIKTIQ